jgi:hypothetical protein
VRIPTPGVAAKRLGLWSVMASMHIAQTGAAPELTASAAITFSRIRGECMTLDRQIALLFVLPIPIASIAWTVIHEEIFREPRDWCATKSKSCKRLYSRKFFYLFTCEYCFTHYVTAFFLFITRYKLLFDDWRGYLVAGFSLVWLANVYMSFFGRLRLEIREDRLQIAAAESRERTEVSNAQNDAGKQRGPPS